jgi:hypothetical protein
MELYIVPKHAYFNCDFKFKAQATMSLSRQYSSVLTLVNFRFLQTNILIPLFPIKYLQYLAPNL